MKKILSIFIVAFVCGNILAVDIPDRTAMMTITLSHDKSTNTDKLNLIEMPTATLSQMNTFSSNKLLNSGLPQNLNIYSLNDSVHTGRQSTLATTSLEGQYIGVMTNQVATNYTIKFSNVTINGERTLYLFDLKENKSTKIENNATYSFVAAVSSTIENRFMIGILFTPDPGDLEVCHLGDNLEIRNNPYNKNIVIKNEAGDKVIDLMPLATPQIISLADLPKGRYTVEFNDGKEVFVISVKPDVKPAN